MIQLVVRSSGSVVVRLQFMVRSGRLVHPVVQLLVQLVR